MLTTLRVFVVSLCAIFTIFVVASKSHSQTVEWFRQVGTTATEFSFDNGVSADPLGNVFLTGHTTGDLGGMNAGSADAFIVKYDPSGSLQWTRQLGGPDFDFGAAVSADGLGNAYLVGSFSGTMGGVSSTYLKDVFLAKFDSTGVLKWMRQLGAPGANEEADAVAVDSLENIYIAGYTRGNAVAPNAGEYDIFVAKYSADGGHQWTRQLGGTGDDRTGAITTDGAGNVYVSGGTSGSLGGPNAGQRDAFVAKLDAAGELLWTRQLGAASEEYSHSVAADGAGNVFIAGTTDGAWAGANAGARDAFLANFDGAGNLLWTRQLGSDGQDGGLAVSAGGPYGVFLTGETTGDLGAVHGGYDAFVANYDLSGNLKWTRQFGTNRTDKGSGVSFDGLGNLYFSGFTTGGLAGPSAGEFDVFLAKLQVPEPSATSLLLGGLALAIVCRRRQ